MEWGALTPRKLQEEEDDADRYSACTLSETPDSSYQRNMSIESIYGTIKGDDVGSLLQRLEEQEDLSKQQQALLDQ